MRFVLLFEYFFHSFTVILFFSPFLSFSFSLSFCHIFFLLFYFFLIFNPFFINFCLLSFKFISISSVILWVATVSVGVGASQRIPLSVLARNRHKGPVREISHETGSSQGRKVRERQKETAELAAETSRQNRPVKRWESGREETSQQKLERRLLGPVDQQMPGWPTREVKSAFLVALWKFRAKCTPVIACKCTESCTKESQTPLSWAWS